MHDDNNIRSNHDWTPEDADREAALERALGWVLAVFTLLGLWKLGDLAVGGGLGPFIAFLGWLLTALA